jgi:transposase-like protein
MYELGIAVAPCTILRWVVGYSIELSHRCQQHQKSVGRSWRAKRDPCMNRAALDQDITWLQMHDLIVFEFAIKLARQRIV